ncbi:hypothetical protein [Cellvibrio sp. QJXJ]|uniref:hypothetical protein n=1 Tax=Cellvibrio sp. QJXJ TaxID=2964606 RepID=UPI0021C3BE52|nr:hypothetical protein [Cellvibrio sp. QJXJ]UUA74262.1 hypothetical protein NNX04_07425 [Cellvibrio sp. QJXJ]
MPVLNVFTDQEITLLFFLAMIIVIWVVMVWAYIKLIRQDNSDQCKRLQSEDTKYAVQTFEPQ